MPTTPSGKVDRAALPQPRFGSGNEAYEATGIQGTVASVWNEVLGVPVAPGDDFLALGGDSLLAVHAPPPGCAPRPVLRWPRPCCSSTPRWSASPPISPRRPRSRYRPGTRRATILFSPAPLSAAERRLWFFDRLDPTDTSYLVAFAVHLRPAVDPILLGRALRRVVERHPALRTVFRAVDDGPVQQILDDATVEVSIDAIDAGTDLSVRLAEIVAVETATPMDLSRGPLLRARLVSDADGHSALLLVAHHIICDDWSFNVIVRDLGRGYDAELAEATAPGSGSGPDRPVLGPGAFARQQLAWLTSPAGRIAANAVVDRIAGAPTEIDLTSATTSATTTSAATSTETTSGGAAWSTGMDDATAAAVAPLARSTGPRCT